MANRKSKTANFKGKGDHDGNGTTGGAKKPTAAKPKGPTKAQVKAATASDAPAPPGARRTGMPQPGETVLLHTPNPIMGRMQVPAKVIRLNDAGTTLALEVRLHHGARQIFNSVGSIEQPGQQWWSWPPVDAAGAEA